MFESFEFQNLTAPQAAIWLGLFLGVVFGGLAQITRFCLRRAVAGDKPDRRPAMTIWLTALATAMLGTQAAVALGWISFAEHRFFTPQMPVLAIVTGGLMFGAGMVLTRGCVSRLTVLFGSGNLRALSVLMVFAITAHATLKGILSPLRTSLGSVTLDISPALPGPALLWIALVAAIAVGLALRSNPPALHFGLAALLGLLVPLGWVGTGLVLFDEFDPVALQSLSFTAPYADGLFWTIANTAIPANFGVGLVGGTILGAFLLALIRREFHWQSFSSPAQTGRYTAGAILMGIGGTLAGGCSVGAGLAGVPTLGVSAALALAAIIAGAKLADLGLSATSPE